MLDISLRQLVALVKLETKHLLGLLYLLQSQFLIGAGLDKVGWTGVEWGGTLYLS